MDIDASVRRCGLLITNVVAAIAVTTASLAGAAYAAAGGANDVRLAWEDIQTVRPYLAQVEEKLSVTYSELAESLDRANLTISELGRAESEVLEAQNANRILDGMLAAANEKIELQAREIKAMRSTVAWRLSVLLKRVPSLLRRQ
ncbi:MAG: hypothetical protein AAAB11_04335 [Rhizobium giardinii]